MAKQKQKRRLIEWAAVIALVVIFCWGITPVSAVDSDTEATDFGVDVVGGASGLSKGMDIRVIIGRVIKTVLGFLGVVAIAIVMYGGFLYMMSGGEQAKIDKARKWLVNGAIGLAIIFSAYAITSYIFSKIQAAIKAGAGEYVTGGGGGLEPVNWTNSFSVKVSPMGGPVCINTEITLQFSKSVDPLTVNANTVTVKKESGEAIAGALAADKTNPKNFIFTPNQECPAPNSDKDCFDANTNYIVTLAKDNIKSASGQQKLSCGKDNPVCEFKFFTGECIDATPPKVSFISVWNGFFTINGVKVSQNADVVVGVKAEDDYSVGYLSFGVNGVTLDTALPESETPQKSFTNGFLWNTTGTDLKTTYKWKAEAKDNDKNIGTKEIDVTVVPDYCFINGEYQCGKPECSCDNPPIITAISPAEASLGNFVSVIGSGFGKKPGKIYFTGPYDADNDEKKDYLEIKPVCEGSSGWQDKQIIIQLPSTIITGPVKVETSDGLVEDTTDVDGFIGDFKVLTGSGNKKIPGLCSVMARCDSSCQGDNCEMCSSGAINDPIVVKGENFISNKSGGKLYFGQVAAPIASDYQISISATGPDTIKGLKVPVLDAKAYFCAYDNGKECKKADGQKCSVAGVDCICENIVSNLVMFQVNPEKNMPEIISIDPAKGAPGQIITISGKNFGQQAGYVEFFSTINEAKGPVDYSYLAPAACGATNWSATQIMVRVPTEITAEKFGEFQVAVFTYSNLKSKSKAFNVESGKPGPGLCLIDPDNGPAGIKVGITGENMGANGDYSVMFSSKDKNGVAANVSGEWTDIKINDVIVPAGAVSDNVILTNADASIKSNPVFFQVGNCQTNKCTGDETCCANGSCALSCEQAPLYLDSEFMWLVSTGDLPILPAVLVRSCVAGLLPQSPSPQISSEDGCPNGMISATFNTLMSDASLDNNVIISRCKNPNVKCEFKGCNVENSDCFEDTITKISGTTEVGKTNLTLSWKKDGVECTPGSAGCVAVQSNLITEFHLYNTLKKPELMETATENLYKNTWYQVKIKGGEIGVETAVGAKNMPEDFVWQFKTKSEICQPEVLLMKPIVGLIEDLSGQQKYQVSGQYQCQDISMASVAWNWSAIEATKVEFKGFSCTKSDAICQNSDNPICQVGTNDVSCDVGVFGLVNNPNLEMETKPTEPYTVKAQASPENAGTFSGVMANFYKEGFLHVKFSEPKVVNFFPDCLSACPEALVGVDFNTEMDDATMVAGQSVFLYKCKSIDCNQISNDDKITIKTAPLGEQSPFHYQHTPADGKNPLVSRLSFVPEQLFNLNTFYRVVVMGTLKSTSGKNLTGLNYQLAQVEGGNCANGLDDEGDGFIDVTGGYDVSSPQDEKIDYVCGCYDAKNQFISYSGSELSANCGTETVFSCQNIVDGVIINNPANIVNIVKGAKYFQPDSLCKTSNSFETGSEAKYDSFSWVFKVKENAAACAIDHVQVLPEKYETNQKGEKIEYSATPFSSPDECSESGQALNPYVYNWSWLSSKPAVATITTNKFNDAFPAYCDAKCLSKGSSVYGAVCGNGLNGLVEDGEECDDGAELALPDGSSCVAGSGDCALRPVSGDGCSSVCLVEPEVIKLCQPGEITNCCGNGEVDAGNKEECDTGCNYLDENNDPCKFDANKPSCKCVQKEKYCSASCQNKGTAVGFVCGNNKKDAGEDDDKGAENKKYNLGLSCLRQGSKYKLGDANAAAVCGNGVKEGGEECEKSNKNCTVNCVWAGTAACSTVLTEPKMNCCGNIFIEEGEECEPTLTEGCSANCLNVGSSHKYSVPSYCGDGIDANGMAGTGEDKVCETGAGSKGSPFQVADIIAEAKDLTLNLDTKFLEGETNITAEAQGKSGKGILKYSTNDPDELPKNGACTGNTLEATSTPTPLTNLCLNGMVKMVFGENIDFSGATFTLYKGADITPINTSVKKLDNGKTEVIIAPLKLLEAKIMYSLQVSGAEDICGNILDAEDWDVTAGEKICKLDSVVIEPQEKFVTEPNVLVPFTATGYAGKQMIQPVTGVYEWTWTSWASGAESIIKMGTAVNSTSTGISTNNGTTGLINGETYVLAKATVTMDKIEEVFGKGKVFGGLGKDESAENDAQVTVFLCENLWGPSAYPTSSWTAITAAKKVTYINESEYNIGLVYCRDFGKANDKSDDLPKLKIVSEQTTPQCNDGKDNDGDGKIDAFEAYVYKGFPEGKVPNKHTDTLLDSPVGDYTQTVALNNTEDKIIYTYGPTGSSLTSQVEFLSKGEEKEIPYKFLGYPEGMIKIKLVYDITTKLIEYNLSLKVNNSDPDCINKEDDSESSGGEEKLLSQYFLLRDAQGGVAADDGAKDVISLRIFANPEALPPGLWYQKYAPNPAGSTNPIQVDCWNAEQGQYCYFAENDGTSVYISAANLNGTNVFNNIYLLGYSQGANEATLNIFNQLVSMVKFNFNVINSTPNGIGKDMLIRDTKRVSDMVLVRLYLQNYWQSHGKVPQLEAGTYVRNKTFSAWDSWQNELGKTLGYTLPVDPINHFKWDGTGIGVNFTGNIDCPVGAKAYKCANNQQQCVWQGKASSYCVACPSGYDKLTCYNSEAKQFKSEIYKKPIADKDNAYYYKKSPIYYYEAGLAKDDDYKLGFQLESELQGAKFNVTPLFSDLQ